MKRLTRNRKTPKHSTTGFRGVSIFRYNHYGASHVYRVIIQGRYYGQYRTVEEATKKARDVWTALGYVIDGPSEVV